MGHRKAVGERLWLVYDWLPRKQQYLAIVTDRHPRRWRRNREEIAVLTVELHDKRQQCVDWFRRMLVERPWEGAPHED